MIDSKYTFADLEERADVLLFQAREKRKEYELFIKKKSLTEELTYWELKYQKEKDAVKTRNILKYVFGGLAVGSFGTSGSLGFSSGSPSPPVVSGMMTDSRREPRHCPPSWHV